MKTILSLVVCMCIAALALGQKNFTEFVQLPEKKIKKLTYVYKVGEPKMGFIDFSKVDVKTVALVSFSIKAPEVDDYVTGKVSSLTDKGLDYFVNAFYEIALPEIQNSFKEQGIELLSIDQMNDDQKSALADFGTDKFAERFLMNESEKYRADLKKKSKLDIGSTVQGYQNFYIKDAIPGNMWVNNPLADLTNALGVDAILIVTSEISVTKKVLFKQNILTLIGPNPDNPPGGEYFKMKPRGYAYGQVSSRLAESIEIGTTKKGELIEFNITDYNKFMNYLSSTLANYYTTRRKEMIETGK